MKRQRRFIILFVFINLVLSSFFIDTWPNANTTSRALPIITFFEDGTFCFDKYHELTCDKSFIDGHYYSDKAPLPTFFVLPFFGTLVKTGIIQPNAVGSLYGEHIYILGGILAASIPFVIILLVLFYNIRKQNEGISPLILTMLPFYGSFIFVFTGSYFAHIFSALLLLGSYLFLKKEKFFLSGIFAGLAFISEYNLAVIFLIWGMLMLYKKRSLKPVVNFGLGVLPSLFVIMIYNYHFTGSPFDMLYKYHTFDQHSTAYGFGLLKLEALWGLSFSWYRGAFFFAPFLILLLFTAFTKFKKTGVRLFTNNYLVLPSVLYFLFIASFFAWSGGWSLGPRFLTGVVVLLIFEGIRFISKNPFPQKIFYGLVIFGIIVAFFAKATIVYSAPTEEYNPLFNVIFTALISGEINSNNVLTMTFNISPLYSFIIFIGLFIGGLYFLSYFYRRWQQQ